MMNALDSPLEALAINYVRFGLLAVVNNLWMWVAVLTAALSFWRMRVTATAAEVGCSSSPRDTQLPLQSDAADSNVCRSSVVPEKKPAACPSRHMDVSLRAMTASTHPLVAVSDSYEVTKGRFTVYYDDDDCDIIDRGQEAEVRHRVDCTCGLEWWSGWERVLRMSNGEDMGWYRHQDLTVLNGSVVRLWDDAKVIRWGA